MLMQYTDFSSAIKMESLQLKKFNIFYKCSKHKLVVLESTHNLYFGAKIRKLEYLCILQCNYIEMECKGVFIPRTCFPDEI